MNRPETIGIVGLGYVGLPLAIAFTESYEVIGYDAKRARIDELNSGKDHTGEVESDALASERITFTSDPADLGKATFIIVAVPTPIDASRNPDLTPLILASELVGKILKPGMMIVYESTVYPGVTEEICLPILERTSGFTLGEFDLGYSPERINPGDKEHSVRTIVKVVSGHNAASSDRCAEVYGSIITAGVHRAATIKTAEAAKVIENVQRDLNIALMNELSKIFSRMNLRTQDVLEAAGTKWNFHKYHPGLVGGHCIGVDPYYLTKRAIDLGYNPEVILSGRKINDGMGSHVADTLLWMLNDNGCLPKGARVLLMGLTFKENVPDCRNSRAVDVIAELKRRGAEVLGWEPLLADDLLEKEFGLKNTPLDDAGELDGVILINSHDAFKSVTLERLKSKMRTLCIFDAKNFYDHEEAARLGFNYRSL